MKDKEVYTGDYMMRGLRTGAEVGLASTIGGSLIRDFRKYKHDMKIRTKYPTHEVIEGKRVVGNALRGFFDHMPKYLMGGVAAGYAYSRFKNREKTSASKAEKRFYATTSGLSGAAIGGLVGAAAGKMVAHKRYPLKSFHGSFITGNVRGHKKATLIGAGIGALALGAITAKRGYDLPDKLDRIEEKTSADNVGLLKNDPSIKHPIRHAIAQNTVLGGLTGAVIGLATKGKGVSYRQAALKGAGIGAATGIPEGLIYGAVEKNRLQSKGI